MIARRGRLTRSVRPCRCQQPRSGDEEFLAISVEVSAPGTFGVVGEQQGGQERRAGIVLPCEVIAAGRVDQRLGDVDLQARSHGQHSGVEGHVAAGAGGQAVARVQALGGRAVLPRLNVPGHRHPAGHARGWVQAAKDTPVTAVGQHIQREYVLSDAGRSQDNPFGILLWPVTLGGATGNLIPQGALEYRRAQLVLAEEGKLAAVLEVEEIGQAGPGRCLRRERRAAADGGYQ